MTMIGLGALVFCCLCVSSTRADCENGWKSFRDSCYLFVDNFMDWYDAQADCVRRGGHLVDIVDAGENEFVHSNLHDYWNWHHIGLTDRMDEGTFKWVTGTAMEYDNFWPGEPNNSRGKGRLCRNEIFWTLERCFMEASDSGNIDGTTTEQYDFVWK